MDADLVKFLNALAKILVVPTTLISFIKIVSSIQEGKIYPSITIFTLAAMICWAWLVR